MKIQKIKDINNNNYIGIDINPINRDINGVSLSDILSKFISLIDDPFNKLINLLNRNNGKFHITIMNVPEFNRKQDSKSVIGNDINDIIFKGIGSITKDDMVTYFIIVESNMLNSIRQQFDLTQKDFHITIGFSHKDLFNSRKNIPNIFSIQ